MKIDGTDLKDIGIRAKLESELPAAPSTRDKTLTIPGRHGAYDFGAYFSERDMSLECRTLGKNNLMVQSTLQELKRLLFDDYGRPKTVQLVTDVDPDRYYNVRFSGDMPIEYLFFAGDFELPLTAYDPWAYSLVDNSEGVTWGSEDITFSYTYLFGNDDTGTANETITTNTTINAFVSGYALRPIFSISGSATNVTFSANGKSFSLPSFSNADYTIDGERYTVIKNGNNGMSDFTGDFLELLPGDNNINITGSGMNFELSIKYRDKFM